MPTHRLFGWIQEHKVPCKFFWVRHTYDNSFPPWNKLIWTFSPTNVGFKQPSITPSMRYLSHERHMKCLNAEGLGHILNSNDFRISFLPCCYTKQELTSCLGKGSSFPPWGIRRTQPQSSSSKRRNKRKTADGKKSANTADARRYLRASGLAVWSL